jgi:hypothetical protein
VGIFNYIRPFYNNSIQQAFKLGYIVPVRSGSTTDRGTPFPSTSIGHLLPFVSPIRPIASRRFLS